MLTKQKRGKKMEHYNYFIPGFPEFVYFEEGVKEIEPNYCEKNEKSKVENVYFPESLKKIGSFAFQNCKHLRKIEFPSNLKEIGEGAFLGTNLSGTIVVPDSIKKIEKRAFHRTYVTDIITASGKILCKLDGMFLVDVEKNEVVGRYKGDESGLFTDLEIPEGVEKLIDFSEELSDCEKLYIPKSVTKIDLNDLLELSRLEEIHVHPENKVYADDMGILFTKDRKSLLFYPPNSKITAMRFEGLKKISANSMFCCENLTSIVFTKNITKVDDNAFGSLKNLETIMIEPGFKCELPFTFIGENGETLGSDMLGGKRFEKENGIFRFVSLYPLSEIPKLGCDPEEYHPKSESKEENKPKSESKEENKPKKVPKGKFKPLAVSKTLLSDIAGLEEAKEIIHLHMVLPRKKPELFKKFNVNQSSGMLLYGPPGTGKTMLARAIAYEMEADFFSVSPSDIMGQYVGENEENIKSLFKAAKASKNAVIFFDDFDAIGNSRSDDSKSWETCTIAELLIQIQGIENSKNNLMILAATNRPWDIDPALTRSGRFSKHIFVDLPVHQARSMIFRKNIEDIPHSKDIDFDYLATQTEGYSGADIAEICQRAKLQRINLIFTNNDSCEEITMNDLKYAISKVKSTVSQKDVEDLKRYYETGTRP